MDKRPILKTLRAMAVGDVEVFPLSQYQAVRNAQYFGMRMEKALGWVFTYDVQDDNLLVAVTREA